MAEEKSIKKTKPASAKATARQGKAPEAEVKVAPKAKKAETPKGEGFAVIETGGKQYGVSEGETIKIEKMVGEFKVGDSINFDKVLLSGDKVGAPYVTGAKVSGTISEIGRSQKVTVIKYKQKSRYFKKNGHRQPFFKVVINSIV